MMRAVGSLLAMFGVASAFDSPIIGDDPRAPVEVDEMLMCESCLAIVDHVMTDLKKKGKVKNQEVAITGLLDDVCDQSNMKRFKFIPPKMVKGCQAFMDEYDGEFEKPLFEVDLSTIEALTRETRDNRPALNALQDQVCAQTINVCKGVTVNPPRIEKPKVNIEGAPQVKTAEDVDEAAPPPPPKKKGKKKKKSSSKEEL